MCGKKISNAVVMQICEFYQYYHGKDMRPHSPGCSQNISDICNFLFKLCFFHAAGFSPAITGRMRTVSLCLNFYSECYSFIRFILRFYKSSEQDYQSSRICRKTLLHHSLDQPLLSHFISIVNH